MRLLLICLGGAVGTGVRYLVAVAALRWLGTEFPFGTLIVNLAGAFAIGLVQQVAAEMVRISDELRLFLTTGVMGGLTTYSAFALETVELARSGAPTAAAINVVVTTVACLGMCVLGIAAGHWIAGGR